MTKTEEGLIEMKQTGLIDRILDALGLDTKYATSKWTPAEGKPLTKDETGEHLKVHLAIQVWLECFFILLDTLALILHMQ
eukprot:scaffold10386_cov68-Cyclotella_meneghiniana.AAC.2